MVNRGVFKTSTHADRTNFRARIFDTSPNKPASSSVPTPTTNFWDAGGYINASGKVGNMFIPGQECRNHKVIGAESLKM